MRTHAAIVLALLLIVAPSYAQELGLDDFLEVAGEVRAAAASPVGNALVIAFSLSDSLNLRTVTGRLGDFTLPPLPVGVYRVVAVKRGYLPAFTTVTPTKKDHRVVLKLENQTEASEARKADAWAIRRSLPRDVLREVEIVLGTSDDDQPLRQGQPVALLAGRMESVAGYSGVTSERELERAAVSLSSGAGQWGVDFRGRRQLVGQSRSVEAGDPAESADVILEVRSSPTNSYRIASTRASWQQAPSFAEQAGVETHSVAWHGGKSSVEVRYESHENLFSSEGVDAEATLEVAGNAMVFRGERSDLGVSVRLRQDNLTGSGFGEAAAIRYADLATTGRHALTDFVGIECGLVTRVGEETLQVMPHTTAEFRLGRGASIRAGGAYKFETTPGMALSAPGITRLGGFSTIDTRYRYSITVASDLGEQSGISASARRAAADALTLMLFDDRFDEFWDGLYLAKGDVLTEGVLSIRTGLGQSFEISMLTSAGRVASSEESESRQYVSGEIRSRYEPSGTTLDVSYRLLEQPDLADADLLREIERLSVVVGQSLHLPVDLRLLLGFSVASEGEIAATAAEGSRTQTRLVGGVSFSF